MNIPDRIKQVRAVARDDKEAISMLLSACADIGSAQGALLSVSKFDDAAEIILSYMSGGHCTPDKAGNSELAFRPKLSGISTGGIMKSSEELLNELREILEEYADDNNYYTSTRSVHYISNGRGKETFYEFDGDSSGAKRGLEILKQLQV